MNPDRLVGRLEIVGFVLGVLERAVEEPSRCSDVVVSLGRALEEIAIETVKALGKEIQVEYFITDLIAKVSDQSDAKYISDIGIHRVKPHARS